MLSLIEVRRRAASHGTRAAVQRRQILAVLFLICASLCACATAPPRAKVKDQWIVTPRHSATIQHPPAPMRSEPASWKGIQIGRSTRSEIEARFGTGRTAAGWSRYEIDQIPALIAYSPDNRVTAIRVPPSIAIDQATLTGEFGPPNRVRRTGSLVVWDYEATAVSVEFASGNSVASMVEINPRPVSADAVATGLGKRLVPIRPPLGDLAARRAAVAAAMGLEVDVRYSLVTSESERIRSQQYYGELSGQSAIVRDQVLQDYLDGLVARLASVTPTTPSEWKIAALDAQTPNALNLGGAVILITRGVFTSFDTEGELAYIVSHEMAHQLLHHVASATSRAQFATILVLIAAVAASAATGVPAVGQGAQAATGTVAGATMAHFSRADESAADALAVAIMANAGYDPMQSVSALQTLAILHHDSEAGNSLLFATHPDPEIRMTEIKQMLAAPGTVDGGGGFVTTQEFIAIRERYRGDAWR